MRGHYLAVQHDGLQVAHAADAAEQGEIGQEQLQVLQVLRHALQDVPQQRVGQAPGQ